MCGGGGGRLKPRTFRTAGQRQLATGRQTPLPLTTAAAITAENHRQLFQLDRHLFVQVHCRRFVHCRRRRCVSVQLCRGLTCDSVGRRQRRRLATSDRAEKGKDGRRRQVLFGCITARRSSSISGGSASLVRNIIVIVPMPMVMMVEVVGMELGQVLVVLAKVHEAQVGRGGGEGGGGRSKAAPLEQGGGGGGDSLPGGGGQQPRVLCLLLILRLLET